MANILPSVAPASGRPVQASIGCAPTARAHPSYSSKRTSAALARVLSRSALFLPDGQYLAFSQGSGIETIGLDLTDPDHPKAGKRETLLPGTSYAPSFSPDGHWLAYSAADSGPSEVYVTPFPSASGKWLVSNSNTAAFMPSWSRNGREIYYQRGDGRIMVVSYTVKSGSFEADPPRVWADRALPMGNNGLAPDGRFAVAIPAEDNRQKQSSHIVFLMNFFDELKRKAPLK